MVPSFSATWKRSIQPRKQRKYRYTAPLHVAQKFAHVHLSSSLRRKYGTRAVQIRAGDTVKVLRGQFAGREGKVDHLNLKRQRVTVTGIEVIKKDGSKVPYKLSPSNLMITELVTSDRKRKQKLSAHTSPAKSPGQETKTGEKKNASKTIFPQSPAVSAAPLQENREESMGSAGSTQ